MSEQLGRFTLLNRIGSGGMAEVFLARGPAGMCVVKRMHMRLAEDDDLVRMFLDEASLAAQLSHPGIARVFELGKSAGNIFFAMEYVPGFDLYTILQENAARKLFMPPEVAARVAADLAAALHAAHEAVGTKGQKLGIVHRDVSPQNILISTQGQVKLIDFGVARASQKMHQTRAGLVKGKAAYMAPEQVVGAAIDRRVDIYALGLVLFEMLTNHRAIVGEQEMEIILNARSGKLNELTEYRHDVPDQLRALMMRCLSFKADARPATGEQIQHELEAWLAQQSRSAGRPELAQLLKVVPADPEHAVETTPSGKHKKVANKLTESTLRPASPEPAVGKVGDETFRASRRVSSEFLMNQFNADGSRAEVSTDVERKGLGGGRSPGDTGPVPAHQGEPEATMFDPNAGQGKFNGPPTIRGNDPELLAQIEDASRAMARTVRSNAVAPPQPQLSRPTDPDQPRPSSPRRGPEDITEPPATRSSRGTSDVTLIPQRSRAPMIGAVGLLAAGVGAVVWYFLKHGL